MTKKKIDFEASLKQLEALVQKMEQGQLSLDDSMQAFEQGIALARDCQTALSEAEQKVNVLTQNSQGEAQTKPFDSSNVSASKLAADKLAADPAADEF